MFGMSCEDICCGSSFKILSDSCNAYIISVMAYADSLIDSTLRSSWYDACCFTKNNMFWELLIKTDSFATLCLSKCLQIALRET